MMNKIKWSYGEPPHVGWWNASFAQSHDSWRFWDGKSWSCAAHPHYNAKMARDSAKEKSAFNRIIQWCDYWPKNARVPRINPEAK